MTAARIVNAHWYGGKNGLPSECVYIGRPGRWGNTHSAKDGRITREEAVALHKKDLEENLKDPAYELTMMRTMLGRNLGCWCKNPHKEIACHGDNYLEAIVARQKAGWNEPPRFKVTDRLFGYAYDRTANMFRGYHHQGVVDNLTIDSFQSKRPLFLHPEASSVWSVNSVRCYEIYFRIPTGGLFFTPEEKLYQSLFTYSCVNEISTCEGTSKLDRLVKEGYRWFIKANYPNDESFLFPPTDSIVALVSLE